MELLEHDLISEDDFESLPDDPLEKFVALEAICRRSLSRLIASETHVTYDHFARLQYMSVVSAAAAELGVEGVSFPFGLDNPIEGLEDFMLSVARATMRIRLKSKASKPYSVQLSNRTKACIEIEINKLRSSISKSDLPESKKDSLLKKLDELSSQLNEKTRISFAVTMSILTHIAAGLGGTTAFLAEAPAAIATITSLIGADKAAEDSETKRLTTPEPTKALPAPEETTMAGMVLDDGIPF